MGFQWFLNLEEALKRYQIFKSNGKILFSTLVGKTFYEWYDSVALAGELNLPHQSQEQDVPKFAL